MCCVWTEKHPCSGSFYQLHAGLNKDLAFVGAKRDSGQNGGAAWRETGEKELEAYLIKHRTMDE